MDLYLQSLIFTADVVAPIFCIVFLGYLLKRVKLIDEAFVNTASKLVFMVAFPALIFMSIVSTDLSLVFNPEQLSFVVISIFFSFLCLWCAAKYWIKRPEDMGVFTQGGFRSNYGIIGLALSFNLFADSGLAQASLLLAVTIPMFNVLSIVALTLPKHRGDSSRLRKTCLEIIKNPLILAVLLALPFAYFEFKLPALAEKTGNYFANLTLPLALLAIGGSLSLSKLGRPCSAAIGASLVKLLILPLVFTLAAWVYGFRGQDLVMLMVLFGCPTATASFVMAKAMGSNAELAANIILLTTLGSVFTLSGGIYIMHVLGVI